MVSEFHGRNDLKQACYEATLDLTLYISQLKASTTVARKLS